MKSDDLIERAKYVIEHGNGDELHRGLLAEVERLRANWTRGADDDGYCPPIPRFR